MDFEKENDLTTYLFAATTIGLILAMYFGEGDYDQLALLCYSVVPALLFFCLQFIKLIRLKKTLKKANPKLLKQLSKKGNINAMAILSDEDGFEKIKDQKLKGQLEMTKKYILFSFYSVMVLLICGAVSFFGRG